MSCSGVLMDVKRFAVHDGPGIRTTLFLKGCPLKCIWCHNPEGLLQQPELAFYSHKCIGCGECIRVCKNGAHTVRDGEHVFHRALCSGCGSCGDVCLGSALQLYGKPVRVEEALRTVTEDAVFYGPDGGVTVSGGEPLLQHAFVAELFAGLKAQGIHTAADTCGCVPWKAFEAVLPYTDLFLYDIKHIDPEKHRLLTGQDNSRILENIQKLSAAGARIEVRIPLVPGCNDDAETLQGIGVFLTSLHIEAVKVNPYHSLARSKYRALGLADTMPEVDSPTEEQLHAAAAILRSCGVTKVR